MKGLRIVSAVLLLTMFSLLLLACGEATPAGPVVEDEWGVVKIEAGEPIVLGFAAALSGAGLDILGIDEQRGAELANEDKPAVLGFSVVLNVQDSLCSAEGGQTVANKFVADPSIVAVIGHMCSSSCTPAADIYEQNGYVMVSPSCTGIALTAPGTGTAVFNRTAWNDVIQGKAAAEFIWNDLGLTKIATVHDGSPYGEQLVNEVGRNFEALGGTVVAREAINVGDTDMKPVLSRIKSAAGGPPELIYFGGFVAEGAFLAAQRADVEMEGVLFMGADGIKAVDFVEAAGALSEGVYASSGEPAEAGAGLGDFLQRYQAKYGEAPPAPFHAHTYDAYMVIVQAIEKVGVKDDDGNLYIGRKALAEAIRDTEGLPGLTGTITCADNGDCGTGTVVFWTVENGEWVAVK
ncbi:MAG: branched-chain amino acid ABC transporter substrate-binding protein [Chloroflexia bacterium]|nr:branched-chain amino acid ABC transporter substrate-binding protein [Chloroflexia bacterium]